MIERVLLVDDEEQLLKAYRRFLQPHGPDDADRRFDIETIGDPRVALERVTHHGPYAVVVSDYKMPGLDGIRFLERVKDIHPATVRIMLTGVADVSSAIDAVNCGAVFRFLTKPCLPAVLTETVGAALRQHQLIAAERQLLEETVSGIVRVLMDTLTLVNPTVSTRAYRMRRCVRHMVRKLGLPDAWELEVAAMLSQFGRVVLGTETEAGAGAEGGPDHAALAQQLLQHIPRFERLAAIIARQSAPLDPGDLATPLLERDRITLGGQVLRAALEFEAATADSQPAADAIALLVRRPTEIDPALVRCLSDVDADLRALTPRTMSRAVLRPGMILDEDLKNAHGVLVMARGHEVTEQMLARMIRMASADWLRLPVKVLVSQITEFEPLPPRQPTSPLAAAEGHA